MKMIKLEDFSNIQDSLDRHVREFMGESYNEDMHISFHIDTVCSQSFLEEPQSIVSTFYEVFKDGI